MAGTVVKAPALKYLFIAEYRDGTTFVQPPDDKSQNHNPKAEHNPSSFTDVDQSKLIRFHLVDVSYPRENAVPDWTVDLRDGHFEHCGAPFILNDTPMEEVAPMKQPDNLKLVYYREARQELNLVTGEKRAYINRYFIGWSTSGKNRLIRTIGII